MRMFVENYLKEMPEDCLKIIYKHVFDISVKKIKNIESDNYGNSKYLSALKRMLKTICIERIEEGIVDLNDGEDNDFPFNQVVHWGRTTGSLKFPFIYNEVDNLEFDKDKLEMNLFYRKVVYVGKQDIRFVRLQSKRLVDLYENNRKAHNMIKKHLKGYYDVECDIGIYDYKMYLDEGEVLFVLKKSVCCMAEFLICFRAMFARLFDELFEYQDELNREYRRKFDADIWKNRMERGIFPNMKEEKVVRQTLDCLDDLTDYISIPHYLNNCDIRVEGNTAFIEGVLNGHDEDDWETESDTD